jgi:MATE family multidrug resistance protein
MFIGRMNNPYMLAGAGLGNMMINCIWIPGYLGLNGALETLVSQAFGARNYYLCGNTLNRGLVTLTLMFIPVGMLLFFIRDILNILGIHDESADLA